MENPQPNTYLIVCGRLASRRAPSNYHQGSGRLLVDPERKADIDCSLITGNPEVILRSARKVALSVSSKFPSWRVQGRASYRKPRFTGTRRQRRTAVCPDSRLYRQVDP